MSNGDVGIEHDDRHGHDAHDQRLRGQADAVGENDQRDQRRQRRRLGDDEHRRGEPLNPGVQAHGGADGNAEHRRDQQPEGKRLQRDGEGAEEREVGEHGPERHHCSLNEGNA